MEISNISGFRVYTRNINPEFNLIVTFTYKFNIWINRIYIFLCIS
jgi:hypothetical protein